MVTGVMGEGEHSVVAMAVKNMIAWPRKARFEHCLRHLALLWPWAIYLTSRNSISKPEMIMRALVKIRLSQLAYVKSLEGVHGKEEHINTHGH